MNTLLKTLLLTTPALLAAGAASAQPAAQQNNTQVALQDQNRQIRELIGLVTTSVQPTTWHIIQYPGIPLVGQQTSAPTPAPADYTGAIAGLRQ